MHADTFAQDFSLKKTLLADSRFTCEQEDLMPCLNDDTSKTPFDAHYLYHTAWAARLLARTQPTQHVDISSCLHSMAVLSAFVPTTYYDYRPASVRLSNFTSGSADLTALHFPDNSLPSLSCMHVVEHIGLERYGDPFDPQGDLKAMAELQRVLAPAGHLLFVVPVGGKARIQYNAHRIYTTGQILHAFKSLELVSFSLVTDSGFFIEKASLKNAQGQSYGCGCFEFIKPE